MPNVKCQQYGAELPQCGGTNRKDKHMCVQYCKIFTV